MGKRHGGSRTRLYNIWACMRQRCNNPKHTAFEHYGGRGIRVCDRWSAFVNFRHDMGEPPPGWTLDRIDNDGDYTAVNCTWSTRKQQRSNQRAATYKAKTHCKRGHRFTAQNTYVAPSGSKVCRTCMRAYLRRWRLRQKARKPKR